MRDFVRHSEGRITGSPVTLSSPFGGKPRAIIAIPKSGQRNAFAASSSLIHPLASNDAGNDNGDFRYVRRFPSGGVRGIRGGPRLFWVP
jgi:hypothetical protein